METSITNAQPSTDVVAPRGDVRKRTTSGRVFSIDLDLLDDNPYQPRAARDEVKLTELCESIGREGQLQPILVRRMGERWQIIFGHGRVQALRRLRETSAKAERSRFSKVRAEERTDVSDDQMVLLALVENVQREDLSPADCAAALDRFRSLRPDLKTIRQIAAAVHMDQMRVKRLLWLQAAPAVIKDAVSKGRSVRVKGLTDESDGAMEGEDEPNPTNVSGISPRETRRLDLYSALELAKLHAAWTQQCATEPAPKDGTPDERMSRLIDRALQQNWSLRRIQAAVEQLTNSREDSAGDESAQDPKNSPAFKEDAKRIIIYRKRLDELSESQKAELRSVLEPIWNSLGGSMPPPMRHDDEPLFSPRRWREALKGWAGVVHGVRKLMHLLNQPVDGHPPKQLAAGAQPVNPQPAPSASAPVSPTAQPPATASPALPKEKPNGSNVSKAA